MKKMFAIFCAFSIFVASSFLTSCSEDDDLLAPTDTWVQKDYTYTSDSGTTSQLTCYFMFTKNGYSNSKLQNVPTGSQNGSSTTIKPGMTVLIVPASSSEVISWFAKNRFICKTFGMGENSVGDDGEEDPSGFSFEMSETKWNVFYYANITDFLKNDQLKNPPVALSTNFSWKKILRDSILSVLK